MPIEDIIARTGDSPITVERLVRDLRALGVRPGMTLLAHSSLSKIGFVCGGAMAVVLALEEVLGDQGTLMMPAMSGEWSDPRHWRAPPVPEAWWPIIQEHWPAWDPDLAQTRKMGAIVESFLRQPDVIRSHHPECSFAARGPNAAYLTENHDLTERVGESTPIGRLNELDGRVLLLGIGHANNTSIHLAESRNPNQNRPSYPQGAAMRVDGVRRWVTYEALVLKDDDFDTIGEAFESQTDHAVVGPIGLAESRLMRQQPLVDFAIKWMNDNR